jgi:hypothetical protein
MSEDPLPRALHQHHHFGIAEAAQPRRLEDLIPVHQRTGAQLGGGGRHLVEIGLKDLDVATKARRVLRRDRQPAKKKERPPTEGYAERATKRERGGLRSLTR